MRMPARLPYVCRSLPYFIANLPAAAVQALIILISRGNTCGRIRILCIDDNYQEFLNLVTQALELIAASDELRYKRVENQIHRIIYLPTQAGASYYRLLRVCVIDSKNLKLMTNSMGIIPVVACVLVHEATHGFLISRRIPYTRLISERIELICCREIRRFADKANLGQTPWG